jgi:predicted O-methyltransferase YrrM
MVLPENRLRLFEELCSGDFGFQAFPPEIRRRYDLPELELNYRLREAPLRLIFERVREGQETLETGAGYSTIVFALSGAKHTAISPLALEHDRIRQWCEERGVRLDNVGFVVAPSQDALPGLGGAPLDFVLIDGDHAFPVPFIDFLYAAGRLRPGGILMVDDTHITTGRILDDFLSSEAGRWRRLATFETASAFERLDGELLDPGGWQTQSYCAEVRPRSRATVVAGIVGAVRSNVALRTRLRGLRDRLRSG